MSVLRDPDAILAAWLDEGPARLPEATKRAIAVTTRMTRQARRPVWSPWRNPTMNGASRYALAAVAVLAVAMGGLYLLGQTGGGVGAPSVSVPPSPSVPTPAASPTSTADLGPTAATSPLEGTWGTGPSTCAQQNAALATAGFTADQLALGGWDATTCSGMTHGSVHTVQFEGGRLVELADGAIGWQGTYEVLDATTVRARDQGWTITYHYAIDGDTLVIDMIGDDGPARAPEADVWADRIAQTVIYESLPFTRQ